MGDKSDCSITLCKFFRGGSHFHHNMAVDFDNGLTKFSGSEDAKEELITAIQRQKNKIISRLTDVFGNINNVKMTITKKGQQNLLFKCPTVGCEVQEHELKRHLIRKKHGWTEKEAARHVSFCTRFYKYITKLVKIGVLTPRFCVECDSFYSRIDNHLSVIHKFDKSDETYKQLKDHSTKETERFLNAPVDLTRFRYKTTKDFHFRKGKIF